MRPLTKGEKPPVLIAHEVDWREEYIADKNAGKRPLPSRWTHAQIRSALIDETGGRCAYCDGNVRVVAFGDVEHFRPRDLFPELVVEWTNLTFACQTCNNAKSNKWNSEIEFVSPYVDDIGDHLAFVGPLIHPITDRGVLTVKEFGLDQVGKFADRARQVDAALNLFSAWKSAADSVKLHRARIIDAFLADTEYLAAVQSALRSVGYPLDQLAA